MTSRIRPEWEPPHTPTANMPALTSTQRKAIQSHWSPRVAKAICRIIRPDFKGDYEKALLLLTEMATKTSDPTLLPGNEGFTSYAREAREKGVLFLWPYHYTDTRVCNPSHYMYYILNCERAQVNALLAPPRRLSDRLNAKILKVAFQKHEALMEFDRKDKVGYRRAMDEFVKAKTMLTLTNANTFERVAYGWDR